MSAKEKQVKRLMMVKEEIERVLSPKQADSLPDKKTLRILTLSHFAHTNACSGFVTIMTSKASGQPRG